MVGHTHDDIDQMFSRFSTALKFSEASVVYSVPQLMKVIELSFSPTPHVVFLTEMYDWKTELDKFSTHVLGSHPVHGHCRPLQYLVSPTESGGSVLKWKMSAEQDEWFPRLSTTEPIHLLKEKVTFENLQLIPHKPFNHEDRNGLVAMYKRASRFCASQSVIEEQDVYLQSLFTGDRTLLGSVGAQGFVDLPESKKWRSSVQAEDLNEDSVVYENDVHTDDENAVYQGRLHSTQRSTVTHKSNFTDASLMEKGQLAIFRLDEEIAVAKVLEIYESDRTVKVHWYKGNAANSLKSAQRPLDKKAPAGMSAKQKQKYKREKYVQVIGFDYLVVEKIELNANKHVKHKWIKLAEQRIKTANVVLQSKR